MEIKENYNKPSEALIDFYTERATSFFEKHPELSNAKKLRIAEHQNERGATREGMLHGAIAMKDLKLAQRIFKDGEVAIGFGGNENDKNHIQHAAKIGATEIFTLIGKKAIELGYSFVEKKKTTHTDDKIIYDNSGDAFDEPEILAARRRHIPVLIASKTELKRNPDEIYSKDKRPLFHTLILEGFNLALVRDKSDKTKFSKDLKSLDKLKGLIDFEKTDSRGNNILHRLYDEFDPAVRKRELYKSLISKLVELESELLTQTNNKKETPEQYTKNQGDSHADIEKAKKFVKILNEVSQQKSK